MATVNFSGVSTGIDWNLIIDATIQARRRAVITPIQKWQDNWEQKLTAYDQLRTHLQTLRAAVAAMDTPAELRSTVVKSSDVKVVDASVSSNATPGSHTVLVDQLARAETQVHVGVDDDDTVVNNSGAEQFLAFTYAGTTVRIGVASGTTLSGLVRLINTASTNPGVVASILDDGSGSATSHHLVLTGRDTGAGHTIAVDPALTTLQGEWASLTADAGAGASSLSVADASPFVRYQAVLVADDDSPAEVHVIDSIAGTTLTLKGTLAASMETAQNAYVTPGGIGSGLAAAVSAGVSRIAVSDAAHFQAGKTVLIADGAGYEEATIASVDTDTNTITLTTGLANGYAADAYVTQLEGGRKFTFEDADFTQTQSAQNARLRVNGYPAGSWIERESNTVSDVIPGLTLALLNTSAGASVTVTVSEDREGVKRKIKEFVNSYNAVKTFINEATSYDPTTGRSGDLAASYAAELTDQLLRNLIIGPVAGFDKAADAYTLLAQVGIQTVGLGQKANSALGTLTLDEETLDEALANHYEDVVRLFSDDFRGFSSSTDLAFYQASKTLTTPGKYDVEVTFDGAGTILSARMKGVSESAWRDATVQGDYVVGSTEGGENGLWVRAEWDGVSATQTAVVRVARGVAGSMRAALEDLLDTTDGLLHTIDENYGNIIKQIQDRIDAEEARLKQLREQLMARYSRLEQLLVQLQGQQAWAANLASSMSKML